LPCLPANQGLHSINHIKPQRAVIGLSQYRKSRPAARNTCSGGARVAAPPSRLRINAKNSGIAIILSQKRIKAMKIRKVKEFGST